jgi:methionine--tRNA ligase beta chain
MFVEGPPGTIGPDGKPTETVTEENYFFKLSEYQERLINLIESGTLHIQPEMTKNEVLSFLRGNVASALSDFSKPIIEGGVPLFTPESLRAAMVNGRLRVSSDGVPYVPGALKDLSISRTTFDWGIPVPGNPKHVIYVWLDALANYMTAVGYGSDDPADIARFEHYWPADLHLVGKEITRQHCIYWPAFLMAAGIPLPKSVVANGWLLFEESKMSKSRGNVVRTGTILDAFGNLVYASLFPNSTHAEKDLFGADVLRYYLLAEIPFGESGEFSFESLISRYNGELANGYGNFVSRTLAMIEKYFEGAIPSGTSADSSDWEKGQWLEHAFSVSRQFRTGSASENAESIVAAVNARLVQAFLNSRTSESTSASYGSAIEAFETFYALEGQEKSLAQIADSDLPAFKTYLEERELAEQTVSSYLSAVRRLREFSKTFTDSTLVDVISRAYLCSGFSNWPLSRLPFNAFLSEIQLFQAAVERYLTERKPWKLAGEGSQENTQLLKEVLYTAAESIRIITALLYPVMPYATASVWRQLGLGSIEEAARNGKLKDLKWGGLEPGTKLGPLAPIFPRADKGLAQIMTDMENPTTPAAAEPAKPAADPSAPTAEALNAVNPATAPPAPGAEATPGISPAPTDNSQLRTENSPTITIDDFAKVDLRVAQIVVAERIPKADKLLRLEVDLGPNFDPPRRQILAGIAEHYAPEALIGRKVVIVANLAPRKMRGLESNGMIVAASVGPNGAPVLVGFIEDVELGARLK